MEISQQRIAEAMLLAQFEPEELARLSQEDIRELAMIDDSLEWTLLEEEEDDPFVSADWYKEFLINHFAPQPGVANGKGQVRQPKKGYSNAN